MPPPRSLLIVARAILVAPPGRLGSCARSPSSWALGVPLASLRAGFQCPGGCMHAPGCRESRETAGGWFDSRRSRARTALPFDMQRAVVFSVASEASRGRWASLWAILGDPGRSRGLCARSVRTDDACRILSRRSPMGVSARATSRSAIEYRRVWERNTHLNCPGSRARLTQRPGPNSRGHRAPRPCSRNPRFWRI